MYLETARSDTVSQKWPQLSDQPLKVAKLTGIVFNDNWLFQKRPIMD